MFQTVEVDKFLENILSVKFGIFVILHRGPQMENFDVSGHVSSTSGWNRTVGVKFHCCDIGGRSFRGAVVFISVAHLLLRGLAKIVFESTS